MDNDVGDVPDCDILVEDGLIAAIGPSLVVADAVEVDASGKIALRGFVDTHRHTWETTARGILPDCTLSAYFVSVRDNLGPRYRPEDVYWANLLGALEALNCGVTTLVDWSHISLTPDHSDAAVEALRESGIRAVYAHGPPPSNEWWANSKLRHPEDARLVRSQYFATDDQLVTFALALRAPGTSLQILQFMTGTWPGN